jgi:predicted acyl esterase
MGEIFGADRKKAQEREDVLVYTSPPLEEEIQVIGEV